MTSSSDRVIVITGASAGIGAALAELLAARGGVKLVLVARRPDHLRVVAERCGAAARASPADMTDRGAVKRVVDDTLAREGGIDVWINNAGHGISRQPSQLTDEDVDDMMRANVKTALYGMQEVLPHFQSRGDGHIII